MKSVPQLVNVPDLSELLGVSCETVRRWRKDGMPHKKSGKSLMFSLPAIQAWLNKTKRFKYMPLMMKALGELPHDEHPIPTDAEVATAIIGDVDGFYERVHKTELFYYGAMTDAKPALKDYFAEKYQGWATLRHKIEKDIMEVRAKHGDYYHKSDVERGYSEVGQILKKTFLSQPSTLAERCANHDAESIYKILDDDVKKRLRSLPRVNI